MKIRHSSEENPRLPLENTFEAFVPREGVLGTSEVEARMIPLLTEDRPHFIAIRTSGRADALDSLYGAATARARYLANAARKNAQICVECEPGDEALPALLAPMGFRETSALVRMRRAIVAGPMLAKMPERCALVLDALEDEIEARYFLERFCALFGEKRDYAWLRELRERQDFTRAMLVAPTGLVSEALLWVDGGEGVVGHIYTAPAFRKIGAASYLFELARQRWAEKGVPAANFDVWLRLRDAVAVASSAGYRQAATLKRHLTIDINWEARK